MYSLNMIKLLSESHLFIGLRWGPGHSVELGGVGREGGGESGGQSQTSLGLLKKVHGYSKLLSCQTTIFINISQLPECARGRGGREGGREKERGGEREYDMNQHSHEYNVMYFFIQCVLQAYYLHVHIPPAIDIIYMIVHVHLHVVYIKDMPMCTNIHPRRGD